jgi:hypothetical protein
VSTEGGIRTRDLSLEDAKRKGLDDLNKSVQLDVMDLLDGQKVTYLNGPLSVPLFSKYLEKPG